MLIYPSNVIQIREIVRNRAVIVRFSVVQQLAKRYAPLVMILLMITYPVVSRALNIYVSPKGSDANAGTITAPFKTILKASQIAVPGDTIQVAAGTYIGGFTTKANGTAGARITYMSTTLYGAIIKGSVLTKDGDLWTQEGEYVDVIGFDLDGSNCPGAYMLFYLRAGHMGVYHCKIHDLQTKGLKSWGCAIGPDNYKLSSVNSGGIISACEIYNVGPPGNQSSNLVHGIYFASYNWEVSNNIIYAIAGSGITSWHDCTKIRIINNTIDDCFQGITIGADGTTNSGSVVANNIVTRCDAGIDEEGSTGSNIFSNNLCFKNRNPSFDIILKTSPATGTIHADPNYVNAGNRNYHLQNSSPAINAGTSMNAPATDFDGNTRPQGKGIDIGAYESL